jgi:hypothetical protein
MYLQNFLGMTFFITFSFHNFLRFTKTFLIQILYYFFRKTKRKMSVSYRILTQLATPPLLKAQTVVLPAPPPV